MTAPWRSAPEEHHVYSLYHLIVLRSSGAPCGVAISLHAAPNGAGYVRKLGAINMLLLRSKSFGTN